MVLIEYKGFTREEPLRFDVLVEGCVLVEAKAVEKVLPLHKAQLLSYMAAPARGGNFNRKRLRNTAIVEDKSNDSTQIYVSFGRRNV